MQDELQKIIKTLKEQGEMCFIKPATEEQIANFETENGIVLPKMYKEWLLFSDGGELFLPAGIQLFGVAHRPMIDPHDDWCPDNRHLVIGSFSWGDPLLAEFGSETISIFDHDSREIREDETYENFFDFLNDFHNNNILSYEIGE